LPSGWKYEGHQATASPHNLFQGIDGAVYASDGIYYYWYRVAFDEEQQQGGSYTNALLRLRFDCVRHTWALAEAQYFSSEEKLVQKQVVAKTQIVQHPLNAETGAAASAAIEEQLARFAYAIPVCVDAEEQAAPSELQLDEQAPADAPR
jgi:hypothetical protein